MLDMVFTRGLRTSSSSLSSPLSSSPLLTSPSVPLGSDRHEASYADTTSAHAGRATAMQKKERQGNERRRKTHNRGR